PAREPCLHQMEAGTSGRLCQLAQRYIEVTIQLPLQRRAMRELPGKGRRFHSPGGTRALHQGVQRRSADTQHQRDAEHTLVAYEPHLEARQIIGWSDQGDEAIRRKVDVADTFAGLVEHFCKSELNLLATREQMLAVRAGEGGQQTVFRPAPSRSWQATLLSGVVGISIPDVTACHAGERWSVRCTPDSLSSGRARWPAVYELAMKSSGRSSCR